PTQSPRSATPKSPLFLASPAKQALRGIRDMADIDEVDASADEVESPLFLASPDVRLQALRGIRDMADIDEVDASADEVAGDATSKSPLFLASPAVRLQALGAVGEMELNDEVDAAAHRVEGLSLSRTSAETASTRISVSSVLDNDDILREILLRLRFSICLVRAALVCKGWLLIISDPDFLHHFHNLHPPTLLGFYLVADRLLQPRFVSVEDHPPELGLILGRASTYFDTWVDVPVTIWDCRNGQLLIDVFDKLAVQSPLNPRYGIAIYPQSPLKVCLDPAFRYNVLEFCQKMEAEGCTIV
ncbi:hypothetical protein BRADI_5g09405v3, partial [Brachypodium distachyon]